MNYWSGEANARKIAEFIKGQIVAHDWCGESCWVSSIWLIRRSLFNEYAVVVIADPQINRSANAPDPALLANAATKRYGAAPEMNFGLKGSEADFNSLCVKYWP